MPESNEHTLASFGLTEAKRIAVATKYYESHGVNKGFPQEDTSLASSWWIEITGNTLSSGTYYYGWKRKARKKNTTNFVDSPNGEVSSSSSPDIRAINSIASAGAIPTGTILLAVIGIGDDGIGTVTVSWGSSGDGGGGIVLGKVFSSSAMSATEWTYTCKSLDGGTTYTPCRNGFEDCQGGPGPLGITVGSDGTVNGTTCMVQPIGDNAIVFLAPDPESEYGGWIFSAPNSAE